MQPILEITGLGKTYAAKNGAGGQVALADVDLTIQKVK